VKQSEQFIVINDNMANGCQGFYIKTEEEKKVQDSGETEGESVRSRALRREKDGVGNKKDC
jgi:hypothetical protein